MRYAFAPPDGWTRSPFPPPQRGVYLRAPVPAPSAESASILLFEAVTASGTLEEQLAAFAKQGCEGAKVTKTGKPQALRTRSFPAATLALSVEISRGRDELRTFFLVDAAAERLPLAFIGGARSLPLYKPALDELVASIGDLVLDSHFYSRWVE
jgi:hypothetical protein